MMAMGMHNNLRNFKMRKTRRKGENCAKKCKSSKIYSNLE
jgi:hypothetical protein